MELGDEVRTSVSLPGVPAGTIGKVKEIGRLFVVVELADGRVGYYAARQLEPVVRAEGGRKDTLLGLGDERVPRGSHLCLLPSSRNDLIEDVARYTAAGLEEGEKCGCIFPADWMAPVREAMGEVEVDLDDAVAAGQLVVVASVEMYLGRHEFTAEKQLARLGKMVAGLSPRGLGKARLFGCPRPELLDLAEWWEYELRATPMLQASEVMVLCGYLPRGSLTDQWAQAEAVHPYVVKGGEVLAGGAPLG